MANFRRGGDEMKKATELSAFSRTDFLTIKDGESAIIRMMTDVDNWVTVKQHNMVPTKPGPADAKNWPQKMGSICRNDVAFSGQYDGCLLCDLYGQGDDKDSKMHKAKERGWAIACLREEVRENGELQGYRDQTKKVAALGPDGKPTGEDKDEKAYVILNFGYDNFFGRLKGQAAFFETAVDRDYYVRREGSSLNTEYHFVPLPPVPTSDGKRLDLRNPEHQARYADAPDLDVVLESRANDEFYGKFFDRTVKEPSSNTSAGFAKPPVATSQADDPDRMVALRDRYAEPALRAYNPDDSPEAASSLRSLD